MSTKILMFGWEFPPYNSGGLGPACLGITKSLVKLGVDVTFVLPRVLDIPKQTTKFVFAPHETDEKYNITLEEINSPLNPYLTSESYLSVLEASSNRYIYASNLEEEVDRYSKVVGQIVAGREFDLIHAHDWLTFPAALEAKRLSQKPLILHIHSTEFDRTGSKGNERIYNIEKEAMEKADKIITVSIHTKNVIIKHYGIDPNKIVPVHNGIDPIDHLNQPDLSDIEANQLNQNLVKLKQNGYNLVLFVGRLTYQKGVEYLLKAAQKVIQFQPQTLFIIAGTGDMERYLIHLSAELGISDKVIFSGFARGENLKVLYSLADVFVMPSISEPFGLVGLESLLNHTPVILSKSSGIAEVLQNALKVDFWDTDETANLIVSVLEHDSLRFTLTELGHQEAQNVTWDKAGIKINMLYGEMMGVG